MQVLHLLGLGQAVDEISGGPSTAKVVRVRLVSGEAVSAAINWARARPVASDLTISGQVWINCARAQAEAAIVSPWSRFSRRGPGWKPEADYGPESVAVYVCWGNFTTEERLMWRDAQSS